MNLMFNFVLHVLTSLWASLVTLMEIFKVFSQLSMFSSTASVIYDALVVRDFMVYFSMIFTVNNNNNNIVL